mmetsp:Transcript_262/g.729  ORF Transcript_262/g.729 Transcript_262/m.729 type:complete len:104 (-) Transcript_262:409-720(-)
MYSLKCQTAVAATLSTSLSFHCVMSPVLQLNSCCCTLDPCGVDGLSDGHWKRGSLGTQQSIIRSATVIFVSKDMEDVTGQRDIMCVPNDVEMATPRTERRVSH